MRGAIYAYLMGLSAETGISEWKQPYTADANSKKPYGVIVLGEDIQSVNNNKGAFRSLFIWPYFNPGSFVAVDKATRALKKALHKQILITSQGDSFEIEWVNTGRDFKDDELKTLTKRMEFRIPIIG